jgi:hypothetical protein
MECFNLYVDMMYDGMTYLSTVFYYVVLLHCSRTEQL